VRLQSAARSQSMGVNVAFDWLQAASVIISYSTLLTQDQPERASLSVPACSPAHQMAAPLLESLEGSGGFCFNWRAVAASCGVVFIRGAAEWGVLQAQP
jgi:hypothetical protein